MLISGFFTTEAQRTQSSVVNRRGSVVISGLAGILGTVAYGLCGLVRKTGPLPGQFPQLALFPLSGPDPGCRLVGGLARGQFKVLAGQ